MNIAKHLKHNYTLTRSYRKIGAFGETGEPHILLDRDAWDRGLVVPAYPSLREPSKRAAVKQKERGLNRRTDVAHLSSAEKASKNPEGDIFFGPVYSIPFGDQARIHYF